MSVDVIFIQWNAHGANNRRYEILAIISRYGPLVIIINETFYTSMSLLDFPGYVVFSQPRPASPNINPNSTHWGGGVAILVKEGVRVNFIHSANLGYSDMHDKGSDWLALDIQASPTTPCFRIATGYRSPTCALDTSFIRRMFDDSHMPTFFAGDLNAKSPLWGHLVSNVPGSLLIEEIASLGLSIVDSDNTYYNNSGVGSVLDIWLVNDAAHTLLSSDSIAAGDRWGSDHCTTILRATIPGMFGAILEQPDPVPRWNFARTERGLFRNVIETSLDELHIPVQGEPVSTLDDYYRGISDSILTAAHESIPLVQEPLINRWYSNKAISSLMKGKNAVDRVYRSFPSLQVLDILRDLTRRIRAQVVQAELASDVRKLRLAADLFRRQQFREAWAVMRRLSRMPSRQCKVPPLCDPNGGPLKYTPTEKAEALITAWGVNAAGPYTPPNANENELDDWERIETANRTDRTIQAVRFVREPGPNDFVVDRAAMRRSTKRLKWRAPGQDGVLNTFIKLGGPALQFHLRTLFNLSLATGYLPVAWKVATVVPVPKSGKPGKLPTSWRPISLLPCPAKMLEGIVAEHLSMEAERLGWLPEGQYAFRRHRSAPDAVLRTVHFAHRARARHQVAVTASLDVQAAYDSVWHSGLIYKLRQLPIASNLTRWLVDFLADRKLQARVEGCLSRTITARAGVPQGSPLSPFLYILYTSDLFQPDTNNSILVGYADDLTVSAAGAAVADAEASLQSSLNRIYAWSRLWRQKFNAGKSEAIVFAWFHKKVRLQIDGAEIPQSKCIRVLGVHLTPRLAWRPHFDRLLKRTTGNVAQFRAIVDRKKIPVKLGRVVYYTLVRSCLTYACQVWCNAPMYLMRRLQVVQNACLRTFAKRSNLAFDSTDHLHALLEVPTVGDFVTQLQRNYIRSAVATKPSVCAMMDQVRYELFRSTSAPTAKLSMLFGDGPLPDY